MLTNPNTLGLFDERIAEISTLVHGAGGLLYYDGANFNAIMGKARPGDMGFDIVHFNTHKSFSTPHGGGGPGSGPVAVRADLEQFLPVPRVVQRADGSYDLDSDAPLSIGRLKGFWGNVGVLVRAWAYIRTHGSDGLPRASELAVHNANYLQSRLAGVLAPLFGRRCTHEFVASASDLKREHGVRALDIAKRLMDYGYHPPTIYFPLLVDEAMMFEPTETETRETLDGFADAMLAICDEAVRDPELVRGAPYTAPVRRLDEARAVRDPRLRFHPQSVGAPPAGADAGPSRVNRVTGTASPARPGGEPAPAEPALA
jgi:glycine dehydrogenase subunit 2